SPIKAGESATLSLAVKDEKGQTLNDRRATWESSDPGVATVANGVVTARGPGSATITATVDRRSATYRVTVPTPIDPVAERTRATSEIAAILNAFAAALNRRSMPQLKAAYPTLPPDEESRWNRMFTERSLRRVQADFQPVEPPRIDATSATQQVKLKLQLNYSGQPSTDSETSYVARFEQLGGKWQMVQLQAQ
ncbi:MAG TPA: Ig-like domain-containing protein, partial [Gemmatimonadales bacterium]|nr:Ig-like domain-containing protein [Gemmatimonadales bacterium]